MSASGTGVTLNEIAQMSGTGATGQTGATGKTVALHQKEEICVHRNATM